MAALLGSSTAFASSTGITGQSTAGCAFGGCHDGGGGYNYTGSVQRFTGSVWTTTSTTVSRNAALSIRYYLAYNSGSVAGRGGFDMTANGGTLSEADGTIQNFGGELTHTTPRALTGNDINFNNITWTAPNTEGTFTIFACGQPVSFAGDANANDGPHRCDTLAITVANNAPTVANVDLVNTFTEGGAAAVVDSVITVSDADGDNLNRAEVEITGNYQSGSDTLACPGCGGAGLSASFSAGQLNITGTASVATYDSVLQGVTFSNNSNAPSTSTRTIAFRVRDTLFDFSNDDSTTLNVTAVNDAPVISAPASIGVTEDVASALTGISFSDADATGNIDAAFSVGSGTLNAPVCTGVTVTGTSSARTLTGTPTNVNNCISGSNFTFTTASNVTTTVTLGIAVDDNGSTGTGGVQSDTQNVNLTVTGVNDAPSISAPASIGVTEDVAGALTGISFSDVDAGASSLTATFSVGSGTLNAPVCASVVTGGTATARTLTGPATNLNNCIGSMNLAFTTAANATADVALTVSLTDNGNTGTGGAQAATPAGITLTVSAVNDAPVANPDTPGVPKNSSDNELDVLANDTDVDAGDSQAIASVGTPNSGGSVVIGAPCAADTLCYTPATNFSGNETFTYTMQDGSGAMDSALVTVTVAQGANPVGVDDAATVNEDSSGNVIDVLFNDTDADDGDTKEVTHVNGVNTFPVDVGNGSVSRSGAGAGNTLLYTPDAGYFGGESFTYTVTDAAGLPGTATVNVTVTAINDAPTLAVIGNATINEDAGLQAVNLSGIGSGAANEVQVLGVSAVSSNTAVVPHPSVTYTSANATGSLGYTPVANASGSATITVTVMDDGGTANGGVNTVQRQFIVTVNAVNDAPTLNAIADPAAIDEDAGLQTVNLSGIGSGAANEGQALVVTASSNNTALIPHPSVTYTSASATGSISYAPVANANGSATITVTVNDGGGTANGGVQSSSRNFTVTVNGVNDTPVIAVIPDQVATDNALFSYAVDVTDDDGETSFTYDLTGAPAGMAIDSAGTITWTPPIGTAGVFTPTVEATDGSAATGTRAFQVTVSAPDSDSDGMPDSFETTHGLDPNDASDADEDADGDGVSNLDEYLGGTDPTTDDIAPNVTAPADLVVPATGYLTVVDPGAAAAVDGRDGALTATYDLPSNALRPGRYVVTWTASDAAGNVAQDTQQVDVLPVVDITGPAVVGESTLVFLTIHLNGSAPEYPVLVDYTVSGTAGAADSDLVAGTFAIGGGLSVVVPVDIVNDGVTEPDETLTVTLTAANGGALGSSTSVTMAITDGPVTPHVVLSAEGQAAGQRLTAYQDDGLYDLFAMASEMNGAPHSYDWSASDDALGIDGATIATPSIDPSGVPPGAYTIHVTVTDGIAPPAEASMLLIVAAGSSADVDADVDGIPDGQESVPGVPELLDNQTGDPASTELLETDAPLQLRRGRTSLAAGRTGALIAMGDIVTFGIGAGGLPLGGDSYDNVGGVFDFEVHGLNAGGTAHVVIPLQTAIRPGSVYRKFDPDTGWHDVVVDANNAVASAFSTLGHCPGPASDDYVDDLQPFADCVRLTLTDGGPNDADGVADGVIRDPGGVAVTDAPAGEETVAVGSGAFPALWLALAALLRLRRRAGIAVLALAAALVALPARAEHHVRIHMSGDLASGFDDNVTNAQDDADVRESGFASGSFNADYLRQLSLYTTLMLRGSLQAEHWNSFDGLNNAKATVMARMLYRGDGDFYTPTFGAWLSASTWEFDSEIRDSNEYRGGVFLTEHLTTQLQGRAALNANLRESEGEVFDLSGASLSLNLDWAVAPRATVYTGYQFYDGDVTSTATPSLWIGLAAEAIEADDAFGGLAGGLRAYRLDARAQVVTLGFNYALGRKLSLDLQGQHIATRADARNHYERMVGVVSLLARF